MKAKIPCKIIAVDSDLSSDGEKMICLTLGSKGKSFMENGKQLDCELKAKLLVKPIVVESLKLGATINLTIETDE
jgi:hypothetical protein